MRDWLHTMQVGYLAIKNSLFVVSLLLLLVTIYTTALAQTNPQINYQGKLTTPGGVSVPDGAYNMRFYLYNTTGGATTSAIWTETLTGANAVAVENGLFSVMLGSTTPLTIDFDQTLYLGIEIGATGTPAWDGEMSPRKVLGTVPAAFQAVNATNADNATTFGTLATSSFLRSDVADTMDAFLALTAGVSTTDITITGTATTTNLVVGTDFINDLTGAGLTIIGNALTVSTSSLNLGDGTLGGLSDVTITTPATGQLLSYSGGQWINFATSSLAVALSDTTGILGATRGGTGLASFSAGDLLYADSGTTLARRAIGTTGQILTVSGGVPTWSATSSLGFRESLFTDGGATTYLTSLSDALAIGTTTASNGATLDVWGDFRVGTSSMNLYSVDTGSETVSIGDISSSSNILSVKGIVKEDNSSQGVYLAGSGGGAGSLFIGGAGQLLGSGADTVIRSGGSFQDLSGSIFLLAGTNDGGFGTDGDIVLRTGGFDGGGDVLLNDSTIGNVGVGTSSPSSKLTVAGDAFITGTLRDSSNASGTAGMVLTSTATGTQWVATSSLGISGVSTLAALSDTTITTPATGQLLSYNGSQWVNVATNTLAIALGDTTGILPASRGGTGVSGFGGTNTILYTTAANTLATSTNFTFNGTTFTAPTTTLSGLLTMSGSNANIALGSSNYLSNDGDDEGIQIGTDGSMSLRVAEGTSIAANFSSLNNTPTSNFTNIISSVGNLTGPHNIAGNIEVYSIDNSVDFIDAALEFGESITAYGNSIYLNMADGSLDANSTQTFYGSRSWIDGQTGGATVGYGYYANVAGADTNYAFYAQAGQSYFADNVGIGSTTPSSKLTVAGDAYLGGTLTATGTVTFSNLTAGLVQANSSGVLSNIATSALAIALSDTTGILPASRGGTGVDSFGGTNTILYTTAANTLATSTNFTFDGGTLTVGGNIDITGGVSGISFGGTRFFYASTTNNSIAIGEGAGDAFNSNTIFNVAIGFEAGGNASTSLADHGVYLGYRAGFNNSSIYNNAIGYLAGQNNSGSQNNMMGLRAGENNSGIYNNLIGRFAGQSNSGSYNNIFGPGAGTENQSSYSNIFGDSAGYYLKGIYNDVIGYQAGQYISATNTVALGAQALRGIFGQSSTTNTVAVGFQSGFSIGAGADNNLLLGYRAGYNLTTGANNIVIGYDVDAPSNTGSNQLTIGNLIFGTGINGTGTAISTGNVGIGTSSPSSRLTIAGDAFITGALRDSQNASGTSGQILSSTGAGTTWLSTSSLAIALSDTTGILPASRGGTGVSGFGGTNTILYTTAANTLATSTNFTFDGTNFVLGTDAGLTRGAADRLDVISGDSLRIVSGSLQLNTDVSLSRGAANRLDLASGDSFNIPTNGSLMFGGVPIIRNSDGFSTIIGPNAGTNSSGDFINLLGSGAGFNSTGSFNNLFGTSAGYNNTGSFSNLFGTSAGYNNTGSFNNLLGSNAGYNNTGSFNNLLGSNAGFNNTGSYSEFIGFEAGGVMSASNTIAIGQQALRGGSGDVFSGNAATTTNNVAIGALAGYSAQTGADNNLLLGYRAGYNLTTGANNIVIGYDVDVASSTGSNQLTIGNLIFGTGINGTGTAISTGNIGIGTVAPQDRLSVFNGGISITPGSAAASGTLEVIGGLKDDVNLASIKAVEVVNDLAFVVNNDDDSLRIIDISNPNNLEIIGGVSSSTILNGAQSLDVVGNYVYVAAYSDDSFSIWDVSNPSSITLAGYIKDATRLRGAQAIKVVGNYAYVITNREDAFTVYDISDPQVIREVGRVQNSSLLQGAKALAVSGNYAYVANNEDDSLRIIDISNPLAPQIVGGVKPGVDGDLNGAYALYVHGRYAYVGTAVDDSLRIIDISDPVNPVIVGSLKSSTELNGIRAVQVAGNYAYVGMNDDNSVRVIDVSNPASPFLVAGVKDNTNLAGVRGMHLVGRYLYVVNEDDNSIRIIDTLGIKAPTGNIGNLYANEVNVTERFSADSGTFSSGLNVGQRAMIGGTLTIQGVASTSLLSTNVSPALIVGSGYVGFGTTTPSSRLTVAGDTLLSGNLRLTGTFRDSTSASGTLGQILSSTGTGTQWVSTSTLGLGNGTFTGLSDTPSSITNNRILYTSGGNVVDNTNLQFNGTRLNLGQVMAPASIMGTRFNIAEGSPTTALDRNSLATFLRRETTPTGSNVAGVHSMLQVNPSANTSKNYESISGVARRVGGSGFTVGNMFGVVGLADNYDAGVINQMYGLYGTVFQAGVATTTNLVGARFDVTQTQGTSTGWMAGSEVSLDVRGGLVENLIGSLVRTPAITGGVINNAFGLYIGDFNGVAQNNFGLYVLGTTTNNYLAGNLGIGTTTPTSRLTLATTAGTGTTTLGFTQYLVSTNATAGSLQKGEDLLVIASTTATTSLIGSFIGLRDTTTFGNTMRGLEIQADLGSNTQGENTGISAFARTFGVRGVTTGEAGGSFEPAGGYFETEGTTQGNAIRGYSSTITTAALLSLFQESSTFTGTGLLMNFGNNSGSFSSSSSRYIDLKNSNTSVFTVSAFGTTTIGDGTNFAGLQIGRGGICVDDDGSCAAGTAGRVAATDYFTGNSDLAETYFSSQSLLPGEVIALVDGLTIARATTDTAPRILGVISTAPGVLLGSDDVAPEANQTAYPVALTGRVPVRLSNENGPIRAGDALMLSSLPGIAMKATGTGLIIGTALDDFDDTRAFSDTYISQFGENIIVPEYVPVTSATDPRLSDGCYYSGGGRAGDEPCVPLQATTTAERITEADVLAAEEAKERALRQLARTASERRTLADGREVRVGQVTMFVERRWRYLDDMGEQALLTLMRADVRELAARFGSTAAPDTNPGFVATVITTLTELWDRVAGHDTRLTELELENALLQSRLERIEAELTKQNVSPSESNNDSTPTGITDTDSELSLEPETEIAPAPVPEPDDSSATTTQDDTIAAEGVGMVISSTSEPVETVSSDGEVSDSLEVDSSNQVTEVVELDEESEAMAEPIETIDTPTSPETTVAADSASQSN